MNSIYELMIIGFLQGELTDIEKNELFNWVGSDRKNTELFTSLYETWVISGAENGTRNADADTRWNEIQKYIQKRPEDKLISISSRKIFPIIRTAASWLIIFVLGGTFMYLISNKTIIQVSKPIVVSIPLGSKGNILLPDGTKVWINAGTEIIYKQNYGTKTRTISLAGEAYFDVANDEAHPFIVNTGDLKIKALGTKFNVKAYPEENTVLTTLEEGKIDVQIVKPNGKIQSIVILPGQNIAYQKSGKDLSSAGELKKDDKDTLIVANSTITDIIHSELEVVDDIKTKLYTSWKDDEWIIEREPLGEFAAQLERRYNVKIIFKNEALKAYNFTGTIRNESIEQILRALQFTAPLDFEINKDVVALTLNMEKSNKFKQIFKPSNTN
ncbi:MAG: FecR family protein [Bacteroidales bacterium]|nr:FecR family protein [Bacteroidales bacterium]